MSSSSLPVRLLCEYQVNPLGIDDRRPRLSWQIQDPRRGARQTAYQVIVGPSLEDVLAGRGDLWDSGKVDSDQSVHVEYGGHGSLAARQRCYWRVRVWDVDGQPSEWSEPAWWEMGLLERTDWAARWIASPIIGGSYSIPPAPHLRKAFRVDAKSVAAARLFVTTLGLYEFEINGRRVGDAVFAPGRTEYTRRVPYHVYDVTDLIKSGDNACGAILGDGWYCGHLHSDPRQTYGDRPRLLVQLEIRFTDGSHQMIATDESWKAGEGPIRSSDILMGEDYDARLEIPSWSAPGFDDSAWRLVVPFDDPGIAVVAHRAPPVRKLHTLKPIDPPKTSANKRRHIFDMGQNMVGHVRLRVRNAKPGQVIDLRYTEMLDKDGKPYTTALRSARATDHYTCKGDPEEWFEPRFTWHGFRYVEVRDYPGIPQPDDLTGIVVHSDCPPTGEFECSDPMLNQLQRNIVWSQRGNFIDIPTDCPQRDERLGWTGDAQVFIRTASFNMDVANFFTKWLRDVADSQYEDGHIPSVVPHVKSIHHEGGPAWADACIICPWWVYQSYGDARIIDRCWDMMTRFMRWMTSSYPDCIRPTPGAKWQGYGDWLSIDAVTPPDLIGTAFFAYDASLMAQMAAATGRAGEAEEYRALAGRAASAFNERFVRGERLTVATQTAYVLALHFDLLPDAIRPAVFAALVNDIVSRETHLSTGFVGTPYLNHVLTRFGRADLAYALLHQKTFPSWLFPITHGATTMWERWDGWTPEKGFNDAGMNSYNHYAFGAIGEWMYANLAGIDLDQDKPGYRRVLVRPQIRNSGLTHAKGVLQSVYGRIESEWRITGDKLELSVLIPANSAARIVLPTHDAHTVREGGGPLDSAAGVQRVELLAEGVAVEVGAGRYSFAVPFVP